MTSSRPILLKGAFGSPGNKSDYLLSAIGVINSQPIRLATLVAPRTIICATHYQKDNPLPTKARITFSRSAGRDDAEANVWDGTTWGDIAVLKLDREPAGVKPIAIATLDEIRDPNSLFFAVGIQDVLTNPTPIVGAAQLIQLIGGNTAQFKQSPTSTIENGDSGAPVIVLTKGQYKLVGPNYANRGPRSFWLTSIVAPFASQLSSFD